MPEVMVKFAWLLARADGRAFRQNSSELQPENFIVGVKIPLTEEYIWNADEITAFRQERLKAELGYDHQNDHEPQPIYTAKALQLCLDRLGEFLIPPDIVESEETGNDDGWNDDEDTTTTDIANSEGWDTTETTSEEGWDTDSSKPANEEENEEWDEESEDWS